MQHSSVAAFSQPPKCGLGTVEVQFGADQSPYAGCDLMKNLIAAAIVAGGTLGLFVSSAYAATCSGSANSGNPAIIDYNVVTDTCEIANSISFSGSGLFMVVTPTLSPDYYQGIVYQNDFILPDSFIVNGTSVPNGSDSSVLRDNLSGTFIATLIGTIPTFGTYRMIANITADGGNNITINSATVSAVPLPAALPLLMSALGVFGFFGWRRKRMAAA